jgi:predicted CXXCH cytochrome family protein
MPVMGHPLEGWSKCTACHAPERLVDTAPGHSGIHASECTVCHKPGNLPVPLSRPHRDNQNVACLSCHGSKAPLPSDMAHRREAVCWLCHRLPAVEPPVPAHRTAPGEADCLTCHVAGGRAGPLPVDHIERPSSLCLSCHEVALGTTPGGTPRITVWPAPSTTP